MGGETKDKATAQSSIPRYSTGPVGQQIHSIYKSRLGQFTSDGQYKSGNLMGYVWSTDSFRSFETESLTLR